MSNKQLLAVIELGGYPDFTPIYQNLGYQVTMETKMRKVLKLLKKVEPAIIVAEFNFQSDFRDRTSSIESMMSMVERFSNTQVIIFYDKEYHAQLAKLQARFNFHSCLSFPIDESALALAVEQVNQQA
ncbi:MAG TPA: hypothetical protein ENK78_06480 [Thiothrix sp.]|nr:hypothetical protein [Thiothrix sp.]